MKNYLKDSGNLHNSMCELDDKQCTWNVNELDKNAVKSFYFDSISTDNVIMRQISLNPITVKDLGKNDYL